MPTTTIPTTTLISRQIPHSSVSITSGRGTFRLQSLQDRNGSAVPFQPLCLLPQMYQCLLRSAYLGRFSSMGASYNRSVNGGAGYLIGGEANTASANYVRTYGPDLSLGFTAGYNRTSGLNGNGTTTGFLGGTEVIWRVSRDLEVFGNYSATDQTTTSTLPGNALNQLLHVVGFGVGYSPRLARGKQ